MTGAAVLIPCEDMDALQAELVAKNVSIHVRPGAQYWGTRELIVRDPDRKSIRFTSDVKSWKSKL